MNDKEQEIRKKVALEVLEYANKNIPLGEERAIVHEIISVIKKGTMTKR